VTEDNGVRRRLNVYNAFIMRTETEPKTAVFLQNLPKPTDGKIFETVTTLFTSAVGVNAGCIIQSTANINRKGA